MQKEAFEPTGLIPRSIIRTFDRFLQQLLPGSEKIAIQEYRISRYQILVSIQSLLLLIGIPLSVNYVIKSFVFMPLTEHFWNSEQTEIFLNAYQEKRAFAEMQDFSEKIFFESLLKTAQAKVHTDFAHLDPFIQLQIDNNSPESRNERVDRNTKIGANSFYPKCIPKERKLEEKTVYVSCPLTKKRDEYSIQQEKFLTRGLGADVQKLMQEKCMFSEQQYLPECDVKEERSSGRSQGFFSSFCLPFKTFPSLQPESVETEYRQTESCENDFALLINSSFVEKDVKKNKKMETEAIQEESVLQDIFQLKSLQIATRYNQQSILAITNLCADFFTFGTLYLLSLFMKAQIIILKSFVIESIYSLSDTTKSFLLILGMDLLVGFHSPRAWEIALESCIRHFGLPESENFILLFVALFPVFLDTVFKYWIFRYLNKISPSTVVTYHSMLE